MPDPIRLPAIEPPPEFRRDGLGYIFEPISAGVRLRVDYLRRTGDELKGEVKITMRASGAHLHQANLNLSSTTARNTLAKHLSVVTTDPSTGKSLVGWGTIIEAFCVGVMEAHRVGEPFLTLADVQVEDTTAHLVETVQPFGRATLVYATGGTGKGWYSLRLAVSAATGIPFGVHKVSRLVSVLILDWEDRPPVIKARLRMICKGLGIQVPQNIRYRRMRGALAGQIHQVAAELSAHGEQLVIVDSVEKACGSGGDSYSYQDRAAALFEGLDLLGDISVLLIDHTAAPATNQSGPEQVKKAYGSTFKGNWAGLAFELRSYQEKESPFSFVVLNEYKTNHGPKLKPIGFRYHWSGDGQFTLRSWDPNDLPDEIVPRTQEERCYLVLTRGPCSTADLAEETGLSKANVRTVCNRSKRIMRLDRETYTLVSRQQGETSHSPAPPGVDPYAIEELAL